MAKYIFKNPGRKVLPDTLEEQKSGLFLLEFFYDTIQGEGHTIGTPAAFLRTHGCTLDCQWCDTPWRNGRKYSIPAILAEMAMHQLPERFRAGHHLVLTGGSPLKQQVNLVRLIEGFVNRFDFLPIIEVENECVLYPSPELRDFVNIWNNSPKLANSGMKERVRYKPEVIRFMSKLTNSYFKFVVGQKDDWEEIFTNFIKPKLISREQVILMPLGATKQEVEKSIPFVLDLAIKEGVRFTTREQLIVDTP